MWERKRRRKHAGPALQEPGRSLLGPCFQSVETCGNPDELILSMTSEMYDSVSGMRGAEADISHTKMRSATRGCHLPVLLCFSPSLLLLAQAWCDVSSSSGSAA